MEASNTPTIRRLTPSCRHQLSRITPIDKIKPNAFIYWRVDTDPVIKDGKQLGKGVVTNIPFEERRANVTCYSAECWLLSTNGGKSFDYLSYIQIIIMQIPLIGQPYNFPHVTANTVKRI